MTNDAHGHEHLEPDSGDRTQHSEHPAYRPLRPLIRWRASAAVIDLLNAAHTETEPARAAVERLRTVQHDVDDLNAFVEMTRRALLGDGNALASARKWVARLGDKPPREPLQARSPAAAGHHESGELHGAPWLHPSALLDLTIGAAFTASDADRQFALATLGRRVEDIVRPVAITMDVLGGLKPALTGRERFEAFLDRLDTFERFEGLPLDLGGCLAEILEVLGSPKGSLAQSSHASQLEIDDNTGRVGSVVPDPVCIGARVSLRAKTGQSFVQRPDVSVGFSPCVRLGTDITWSPSEVTVVVPSGAQSGPVYFVRRDAATSSTLAGTAAAELAGAFANCPFLGRGAAASMMVGALRSPLDHFRCFAPIGTTVSVGITDAPEIALFRAVAQNGSAITPQSLPAPADPFSLEWEVTPGSGSPPTVRLFVDGALLAQGLGLRARYQISQAQTTKTYSLEVSSTCGVVRRDLTIAVLRVLRFVPEDVSVLEGQTATLSLRLDSPASTATIVLLTTTPSHSNAPGWVTIPAGQTQVPVNYPAMQLGRPGAAALTVIAYAPRHVSAVCRIWVEPPLGTHEIVADRTGTFGRSAIDVVGVHAALTAGGSILLFAYDESAQAYANVNTGKSAVWDPLTNQVRAIPMSRNLFCAGHAFLGDGRVLVAGGQSSAITTGGFLGSLVGAGRGADHDIHVFDGTGWTRVSPDMPGARWYPTCTTLPDGRVLIVSGYAAHAYAALNGDYEIFDGSANSLVKRTSFKALLPFNHEFDLYPFVQVLPGRNLFVHSHDTTWLLSLDSSNEPVIGSLGFTPFYNAQSPNSRTYPGEGSCVMLPLDPAQPSKARILMLGGGGGLHGGITSTTPASNTAEIFDYDSSVALDAQLQWRFTRDGAGNQTFLTNPRLMGDSILLPDGTLAIVGGAGAGEADAAWPPIMWVESFDPATEVFTTMAGITVPRLYHSTALLLPDGSVMIAGSTGWLWDQAIGGGSDNEFRIEIYHPPYQFRGPRPALQLATTALTYGQSLRVNIPTDGTKIRRAALIRHSTVTHTNNMDQRFVGLAITDRQSTHIDVTLPPDGAVAPPGPYLMFVIAEDARAAPVPSLGTRVMLA